MPTYEYRCSECGFELEEFQSMTDAPLVKCPKCGKDSLKRMFGGGSGMIFKGRGFYLTDYKKGGSGAPPSTPKKEPPKKDNGTPPAPPSEKKP